MSNNIECKLTVQLINKRLSGTIEYVDQWMQVRWHLQKQGPKKSISSALTNSGMEWILRSPEIHSTFGNLGCFATDGYHINENCNVALESILHNLTTEDKYLRSYRRSISFGQYIEKDIIPLLTHTNNPKTLELLIKVLVNLTIPIECLLSVDIMCKTDFGRHTIFEIDNLLTSTKAAFTDHRVTKVLIHFLRSNIDLEQSAKLSPGQCVNISNSLLLLRNILHVSETPVGASRGAPAGEGAATAAEAAHAVQNQLLWTIFSQSVDKVLIELMNIPEAGNWCVTMVQLVALLYREQHTATLHNLLDGWMDASLSDSSEDNESNTSPQSRGSEDSSQMLTLDPTSSNDSSDAVTGGKGCDNSGDNSGDKGENSGVNGENCGEGSVKPAATTGATVASAAPEPSPQPPVTQVATRTTTPKRKLTAAKRKHDEGISSGMDSQIDATDTSQLSQEKNENSDCGYGTQLENQECVSTSSDEYEPRKRVHVKRRNPKQKPNTKLRTAAVAAAAAAATATTTATATATAAAAAGPCGASDRKRKRIIKRASTTIINVQGLTCKAPTDIDISIVLKEFTVDFLLKGFNSLVRSLHQQILSDGDMEIDKSHLFWLVTYFLKFATQIEMGAETVRDVLSFELVAYLTAEGVALCEEFLLAQRHDGQVLKTCVRRMHLVVTAIRELVQAVEWYKEGSLTSGASTEMLDDLQMKICDSEELRLLLVLLLRHYNHKYHTKQYLQDLVVTNHILILFIESILKQPDYKGRTSIRRHVEQFANAEMMLQYATLLEDFFENGEYVNGCVFNMMHHVSGDLGSLISLFQPKILRTFSLICDSEYELCEEWNDLIQYFMCTFVEKPQYYPDGSIFGLKEEASCDDERVFVKPAAPRAAPASAARPRGAAHARPGATITPATDSCQNRWTESELSTLRWNYMQCNDSSDAIGDVVAMYREDGITKSRESVLQQLHKQQIIHVDLFENLMRGETDRSKQISEDQSVRDDEIGQLCEKLAHDGKLKFLEWLQKVLLDTCCAKIYLEQQATNVAIEATTRPANSKIYTFTLFKKKQVDLPLISAVAYHSLLVGKSVPLVPWNLEQDSICKDSKFLLLLHKLGFHMPADTGKLYVRIPNVWTTYHIYKVAGDILTIDEDLIKKDMMIPTPEDNYQIIQPSHTMLNLIPIPGMSYEGGELPIGEPPKPSWLDIVQRSNQLKITLNLDIIERCTEDIASTPNELMPSVMCGAQAMLATILASALDEPPSMTSYQRVCEPSDEAGKRESTPPPLPELSPPCAPDSRDREPPALKLKPPPQRAPKHKLPAIKRGHPALQESPVAKRKYLL